MLLTRNCRMRKYEHVLLDRIRQSTHCNEQLAIGH